MSAKKNGGKSHTNYRKYERVRMSRRSRRIRKGEARRPHWSDADVLGNGVIGF